MTIPHDTMIRAIHLEGVKYLRLKANRSSEHLGNHERELWPYLRDVAWEFEQNIRSEHAMGEIVSEDALGRQDRSSHKEDGNDKVVSVALQGESFYERVSRFVRVEGTRVTKVCSIKVVQQVAYVHESMSVERKDDCTERATDSTRSCK